MALATAQNRPVAFPVALRGVTHSVVQGPMPVAWGHPADGPMAVAGGLVAGGLVTDAGGTMPVARCHLPRPFYYCARSDARCHIAGATFPVVRCRRHSDNGPIPVASCHQLKRSAVQQSLGL